MTRKKSHAEFEDDPNLGDDPEQEELEEREQVAKEGRAKQEVDPNAPVEWTVLTDGAVFQKDKLSMRKADVPPPKEVDGDTVVCYYGDVVLLTPAEAKAKRDSGIALAERPVPKQEEVA
jgi:hypothetical protein